MIALVLAAQLVAGGASDDSVVKMMPAEIVLGAKPAPHRPACAATGPQLAGGAIRNGAAQVQTLNKLPKANHEIAIARMVDGCPKPVVVRYEAGK